MTNSCPRHKRLKREARLQAAKHWLRKYDGNHIVKGYSKHFGVNMLCAALELRVLGYEISEHYIEQLKNIEVQKQMNHGTEAPDQYNCSEELPF